jgi:hypothetical protein|tara:strand:- start:439 stop:975 length:537 start_codon:yes stop_codon:yes gene_type:complete
MSALTVGTATVSTSLIAGTNTYPNVQGNANDVLTTNGAGVLAWAAPAGGGGGKETIVNSSSALSGTINLDFQTSQIYHYTGNAGGNWTVNFRGSSSVTLNSEMSTDQSLTFVLYVQQGSTAYYNNGWQIDGSGKTPKWLGGFGTPNSGHTNSVDVYTYTIMKIGNNDFRIYANQNFYT